MRDNGCIGLKILFKSSSGSDCSPRAIRAEFSASLNASKVENGKIIELSGKTRVLRAFEYAVVSDDFASVIVYDSSKTCWSPCTVRQHCR
jgi:hypothetical protein